MFFKRIAAPVAGSVQPLQADLGALEAEGRRLDARLRELEKATTTTRTATWRGNHSFEARRSAAYAEIADLRRQIDANRLAVAGARAKASSVACESARGSYVAALRDAGLALVAAHASHRRARSIINDLEAADIAWTGHLPNPRSAFGSPWDTDTPIARFLRDLVDAGVLTSLELTGEAHDA